jgi:hypothetical protein
MGFTLRLPDGVQLMTYGATDGSTKFKYAGEVVKEIEVNVAKVYASISIEVSAAVDAEEGKETCGVKVQGCTAAGTEEGCCKLSVQSASTSVSTSAVADVGVLLDLRCVPCCICMHS